MRYAIHPRGVGRRPGARSIKDDTPLAPGETFTVTDYTEGLVLAEDGLSLRPKNQEENDAETAAASAAEIERADQNTLLVDAKTDAVFQALKNSTPQQISAHVANVFPAMTAQQKAIMKILLQVASLVLRRN